MRLTNASKLNASDQFWQASFARHLAVTDTLREFEEIARHRYSALLCLERPVAVP